ncbi:MAG: 2-amino-4-hydroxy-6-hydroxymethyldihydropteridine diphosphokinase [Chloroflexota bacterium]
MSHNVFLSLGTNLGNRVANLGRALKELATGMEVVSCSPVYETAPWGFAHQPDFLNQVVQAHTELTPLELLSFIENIEKRMGRQPTFRYGPRIIDLDILFYDELILTSCELTLPHPHLAERAFVLLPLTDIAPALRHPVLDLTVSEMLANVVLEGVRLYAGGEGNLGKGSGGGS